MLYNYLRGKLTEKTPARVTVDVGGIGFEVAVPLGTSEKLPSTGIDVKLWIHHLVREDAELLFGFLTEEERSLFRLLISVSGIGPKLGITLLSGLGAAKLKRAIVEGSIIALTEISGIGKKIAERLIVELREKVVMERFIDADKKEGKHSAQDTLIQDSLQALVSLGYSKQSAKNAIDKALSSGQRDKHLDPEHLIRESLKHIHTAGF